MLDVTRGMRKSPQVSFWSVKEECARTADPRLPKGEPGEDTMHFISAVVSGSAPAVADDSGQVPTKAQLS